ncbi:unnamed protein product [Citrullus colocynthis]|uniref:Uncharacterized protein n=1 Tax=Citrullus colocynthis TaxID=252529 RepID=A0ABP0ZCW8_9ROSI
MNRCRQMNVAGGQELIEGSPQLYWLCITFLAFDVVFVLICIAIACLVRLAICCCLPYIIAILYTVTDQVVSMSFGSIFWFQFIASLTRLVVNGHYPIVLLFIDKTLEGATKEEIESLPKYKFNKTGDV